MKDPHQNWYARGWKRAVDERGRVRMVYEGEYYTLGLERPALRRVKVAAAGLLGVYLAVYLASAVFASAGAMWRWVGLFQILSLLPALYLAMGTARLCLSGAMLTYRDWHAGPRRMLRAAWFAAALGVPTLGAEIVYMFAFECALWRELIYAAQIVVYTLAAVGIGRFCKRHPYRIVEALEKE